MKLSTSLSQRLAADAAKRDGRSEPEELVSLRGTGFTKRASEREARALSAATEGGKLADKAAAEAQELQESAIQLAMEATAAEQSKFRTLDQDDSQDAALAGILHNRCAVLIGAAGTGKTTLLKRALEALREKSGETVEDFARNTAIVTFTGRASQQCRRALPDELVPSVSTIHALLEYAPEFVDEQLTSCISGEHISASSRRFMPRKNAGNPVKEHLIINDESSMTPVDLWNNLIAAVKQPDKTRFILVGDIHQLPPVSSESVLGYAMAEWPVFELTKIHRNAGPIIENAWRILHGQFPVSQDHFWIFGTRSGVKGRDGKHIKLPKSPALMQRDFVKRMFDFHKAGLYDPTKDMIIVPKKTPASEISSVNLSLIFAPLLNATRKMEGSGAYLNPRTPIHTGTRVISLAVGDKIMITANVKNFGGPPITNGQTGIVERITLNPAYNQTRANAAFKASTLNAIDENVADNELFDIDADALMSELTQDDTDLNADTPKDDDTAEQRQASHIVTIRFDTGQEYVASTSGAFANITFGYAITCHKAEGGEARNVFILMHRSDCIGSLCSNEWLYTAITRAKENLFLFTDDDTLAHALTCRAIQGVTLEEKVQSFIQSSKTQYGTHTLPKLPRNTEVD